MGGLHYDSAGQLVISLTDLRQEANARAVIAGEMRMQRPQVSAAVVRRVRFGFAELAEWKAAISRDVLGTDGVSMLDIDEARNRVVIGVATTDAAVTVRMALSRAHVPEDAVTIETRPYVRWTATLASTFRPVRAALRINAPRASGAAYACTLGYNAYLGAIPRSCTA